MMGQGGRGSTRTDGGRYAQPIYRAGVAVVVVSGVVIAVGLAGVAAADEDRGHGNECDGHDGDNPTNDHDGDEPRERSSVDDRSPNHNGGDCDDGRRGDDGPDGADGPTDGSTVGDHDGDTPSRDAADRSADDHSADDETAGDSGTGGDGGIRDDDGGETVDGGGDRDAEVADEEPGIGAELRSGSQGAGETFPVAGGSEGPEPPPLTGGVTDDPEVEERYGLRVFASGLVVLALIVAIAILSLVHSVTTI